MKDCRSFGAFIKRKRVESGKSQLEVSSYLGYKNSQFTSNVERGLCMFPLRHAEKLCLILGLSAEELREEYLAPYVNHVNSFFERFK